MDCQGRSWPLCVKRIGTALPLSRLALAWGGVLPMPPMLLQVLRKFYQPPCTRCFCTFIFLCVVVVVMEATAAVAAMRRGGRMEKMMQYLIRINWRIASPPVFLSFIRFALIKALRFWTQPR